jgi:hypothetical protein
MTGARWLARTENRRMVARGIALLLTGLLVGGAITRSEDSDRKRGEKLTREQYEKDFASYRNRLIDRSDSPVLNLLIGVILAGVTFVALEGAGVVIGVSVGAVDEAMERRRSQRRLGVMDDTDD